MRSRPRNARTYSVVNKSCLFDLLYLYEQTSDALKQMATFSFAQTVCLFCSADLLFMTNLSVPAMSSTVDGRSEQWQDVEITYAVAKVQLRRRFGQFRNQFWQKTVEGHFE